MFFVKKLRPDSEKGGMSVAKINSFSVVCVCLVCAITTMLGPFKTCNWSKFSHLLGVLNDRFAVASSINTSEGISIHSSLEIFRKLCHDSPGYISASTVSLYSYMCGFCLLDIVLPDIQTMLYRILASLYAKSVILIKRLRLCLKFGVVFSGMGASGYTYKISVALLSPGGYIILFAVCDHGIAQNINIVFLFLVLDKIRLILNKHHTTREFPDFLVWFIFKMLQKSGCYQRLSCSVVLSLNM